LDLEVETTPENLAAEDKIYYRYLRVKSTDFKIVRGQSTMSTYFVKLSAPPILAAKSGGRPVRNHQ